METIVGFTRAAVVGSLLAVASISVRADGDLTSQEPVTVTVRLGDERNRLRFEPSALVFQTGKLYRLVIVNPSPQKHYFSSDGLARAVFTRKVQIERPDGGAMVEVKGVVREIEVYPGAAAQWWFVPVKAGSLNDLRCTIAGHTEAGMVGRITIR